MGTGTEEDESSTERVCTAVYHHVTARSRLARVLKVMNRLFIHLPIFLQIAVNRGLLNQWIWRNDCIRKTIHNPIVYRGARGGAVVETLRYEPEGRGIHS
jgi:hypothetical protein